MNESNTADSSEECVDIAIIGAGPTGLFGAFYAGMRGMSVKLLDSLDILGGQLMTLYPEKFVYDVAGFPKVMAKDLAHQLIDQAMQYSPKVHLGQQIMTLTEIDGGAMWRLGTATGSHLAKTVLISAGVGAFQHKTLPLSNAKDYHGKGLHYFVKELSTFSQKRVLIVGGGDSAVDWANMLAPIAGDITLIHRRDQFRAHEDSVKKMRATPVKIRTFHELKSIHGEGQIAAAVIYDNRSNAEERIEIDAILVNIGFSSSLGPIKDWGLTIEKGQIAVNSTMQTNRRGVFAAGDIATFPGKLKLIATGFGEACTAVCYAKHAIDPAAKVFPGHSSEMSH